MDYGLWSIDQKLTKGQPGKAGRTEERLHFFFRGYD